MINVKEEIFCCFDHIVNELTLKVKIQGAILASISKQLLDYLK